MIVGIGVDLVDIGRIKHMLDRHGERFLERCFTDVERHKAQSREKSNTHVHVYAKRFAAKEAFVKALGTGFTDTVIMKDVGVIEDGLGKPSFALTAGAQEALDALTPAGMEPVIHLSLTDEPPYAQAYVIIEMREAQ